MWIKQNKGLLAVNGVTLEALSIRNDFASVGHYRSLTDFISVHFSRVKRV